MTRCASTRVGLALLGLAMGLLQACAEPQPGEEGAQVPPLRVLDHKGQSRDWQASGADYVLLNIWAPWCAPCIEEMPSLDRLNATAEGLSVVGLAPAENVLLADEFLRKHNIGFPTFFDAEEQIDKVLNVGVYPSSLLLSPRGRIIGVAVGPREWDAPEQREWINQRIRTHGSS